ncbi:MAG: ATP phosphoribosyltransferase regulatory subunit, partial [Phycisphaerae bacterium]|nr:ATP phosphoribosyltransferase regulatory subunit [Phycisphaerae bacterium]
HCRIDYAEPPASAEAAAELAGVAVEQVVKAVSILVDGERAICLVPGNVRFSSSVLAAAVGDKVEQAGTEGPLSPLVAAAQSLPLYVDGRLMDQEEVVIASDDPQVGLRIAAADLRRLSPMVSIVDLADAGEAKDRRVKARLLKGFRDYLPAKMQPRQRMIDTIVAVFERFGFGPLQTPAIEYSDVLLGKYGADAEKLLFRFRDNGGRDVSLRYDLTVPLSRVAGQYGDLPRPFKRYQIAPVWRAEKPGRGRFREFYQCDADVVGSDSLIYDAECVALTCAVMKALEIDGFEIRVSTRKVLAALGGALGVSDEKQLATIFRTIDKLAVQGEQRVRELL